MGFDNECIPNIQSLPGEYFCPVCRQLVYPNEAIQTQCTHLYCKPCLTYIVSTTRACPYDGYLVTEADAKPLIESNKSIAEAIGRIPVYCLYHRSGCTWQGSFSECTTHCTSCPYGSSPVVCNRCGTQIVHRQVQEHAQNCPGTQPLQQEGGQAPATSTAAVEPNQAVAASAPQAGGTTSQAAAAQTVPDQSQASTIVQSQPTSVVPTPEHNNCLLLSYSISSFLINKVMFIRIHNQIYILSINHRCSTLWRLISLIPKQSRLLFHNPNISNRLSQCIYTSRILQFNSILCRCLFNSSR
ncbi:hypothetical protein EJ110_NYTH00085 [Nymphaea thermarum]|nr:hypothetical protein EJ110_NYTH00085 [Nymphaea thermarum]